MIERRFYIRTLQMISQQDIQTMLQEAKITSMSGIVGFIAGQVLTPVQQIQARLCELERPRGMDTVMIEEVKAMVEAMIDQREDTIKRQLERKYKDTATNSFEMPEYSRRSLHEIDIANLMNTQSGIHSQQLRKTQEVPILHSPPAKPTALLGQVRELRQELMTVPTGRDLNEVKSSLNALSKDMVSKITFEEVERLMMRFQKQVFIKISQNRSTMLELESRLGCAMEECRTAFSNQLAQHSTGKQDRRIKKCLQTVKDTSSVLQKLTDKVQIVQGRLEGVKASMVDSMTELQSMFDNFSTEKQCQMLKESVKPREECGLWIAAPITFKNNCVAWQRQLSSQIQGHYQFQPNKTVIRVVKRGIYQLQCLIFGGSGSLSKAPAIQLQGQSVGKLQCHLGSGLTPKWSLQGYLRVPKPSSSLSVRFEGEQCSQAILLRMWRVCDDIQ